MKDLIAVNNIRMTSVELAKLTGKRHDHVLRDIKSEIDKLGDINAPIFGLVDYVDKKGEKRPCYTFGKKGALQLALKYDAVTRYKVIEYLDRLEEGNYQSYNYNPYWYIKWLEGQPIVTLHDFKSLTGIELDGKKPFFHERYFVGGLDWNGLGTGPLREKFERENNVHYEEETFLFLYKSGLSKVIRILSNDYIVNSMEKEMLKTLCNSMANVEHGNNPKSITVDSRSTKNLPIQIRIEIANSQALTNLG